MVTIVDAGTGNLRSLENGLLASGISASVARRPPREAVDAIILPGVGAFGHAAAALRAGGWDDYLRRHVDRGARLIGICLGMQLLFERSEESPGAAGLGFVAGEVKAFAARPGIKVPHMGWARLEPAAGVAPLLSWAYFVHSFRVVPADPALVRCHAIHGKRFPAVVQSGNVVGVQFHPEKSQRPGIAYLRMLCEGRS